MSDKKLDALLEGKEARKKNGRCAICGEPRTVQVYVKLGELSKSGQVTPGRSLSVSATLCTEHGLAAYDTSRKAIGR